MNIDQLRHPKEKTYFTVLAVLGGLLWLPLIPMSVPALPIILIIVAISWMVSQYFKAVILGSSVRVSPQQFPEIYARAEALRQQLGLSRLPDIYVVNSHGVIQATAERFLNRKYVFINSALADLMLLKGHRKALDFVLGHELGHHAAGHVSFWKNLLLLFVKHFPLVGKAYNRACELTADRIGHHLVQDSDASKRALTALALGSSALLEDVDIEEFKQQERQIPELMALVHKVFSSYPRLTRRVIELEDFDTYSTFLQQQPVGPAPQPQQSPSATPLASKPSSGRSFCPKCGTPCTPDDTFCGNCGHNLK